MLKELPSLLPVAEELVKTLSGQIDAGQIGLKEAEEQIVGFIHCIGHLMVLEVVEKVSEPTTENRLRVDDQVAVYKDIKSQRLSCLCPKRSLARTAPSATTRRPG